AVHVDSINRRAVWTWPHIVSEPFEPALTEPCITDADSASSVVCEIRALWIGAPMHHGGPGCVFWRLPHAVLCFSVIVVTAAALGCARAQRCRIHCLRLAAIALHIDTTMFLASLVSTRLSFVQHV